MSRPAPARSETRKYRRLQSPFNVRLNGETHRGLNWSPAGVSLEIPASRLVAGRLESADLLLPCYDGVFSVAVTLRPVRATNAGWAADFIDLSPSDHAVLAAYADAMLHGFSVRMEDLERVAQEPDPSPEAAFLLEEPPLAPAAIFWARLPFRRLLFAFVFIALIIGVGSLVVPFFVKRFVSRMQEGSSYLEVANSRLRTAEITLKDLDAKIHTVDSILNPVGPSTTRLPVSPEQKQMLQLGLEQLTNTREMVDVHREVLRSNIAAIGRSNFFFEQSVLPPYGTESHTDPAPYITQILTDIAVSSRIEPHTPDDVQKYLLVAEARVEQAESELKSSRIQRAALDRILARASGQRQAGAIPFNSVELMTRDIALLRLDEERLERMLTVLRDNVAAVKKGNFMYETNLLQRFDPRPMRATSPNDSALTR